jgi:GT2 family glycosyltransferase
LIALEQHPLFSPSYYLARYGDVAAAGLDPREHFRMFGEREGRTPTPLFDSEWYRQSYPDLSADELTLGAYLEEGWKEERSPHSLFSVRAYFQQRSDVRAAGMEPLTHFIQFGWREGVAPHPAFDLAFYLSQADDLEGMDPLSHYILRGARLGLRISQFAPAHPPRPGWPRRPKADGTEEATREDPPGGSNFAHPSACEILSLSGAGRRGDVSSETVSLGALPEVPLVSVIIANRDGSRHLPDLFDCLRRQTYSNFETIFVDDGSSDQSARRARELGANQVVVNPVSLGFAGANNEGLRASRGEAIALLNNDTRVDPTWLEHMVAALKSDPAIGAVAPKIRFWDKFIRLTAACPVYFQLDLRMLGESLEYQKLFVREGAEDRLVVRARESDGRYRVVIDVPLQTGPYALELATAMDAVVSISSGLVTTTHLMKNRRLSLSYVPPMQTNGFYVINNAGSIEVAPMQPGDRGFGEVDAGQWEAERDVEFLCGCAALIRRDALNGHDLFVDEFVAYYEDSELSARLRRRGYRIRYAPGAVVYHRHSASNVELSPVWRELTLRNKYLFQYIQAPTARRSAVLTEAKLMMNHLRAHFADTGGSISEGDAGLLAALPKIEADLDRIAMLVDSGAYLRRGALRIGVFNAYWNTLGGGEAHALDVASVLAHYGQVELISTHDFPLDYMAEYFGGHARDFRKRLVTKFTPAVSAEYDMFVNCSYQDETCACAPVSLFVVSFPSRAPRASFLDSYYFLANSRYTLSWMKTYWGEGAFAGEILYPSIRPAMVYPESGGRAKEKIILSVGRFVARGHTKNQLQIARAFRQLATKSPEILSGWRLVLAGGVNDPDYMLLVSDVLTGLNAEIRAGPPFEEVRDLCLRSFAYVHASGFGRDPRAEPDRFEHFGIAVAQAVGAGCFPIVFAAAGPLEIVEAVGLGLPFENVDELEMRLREAIALFPAESTRARCVRRARTVRMLFSPETQRQHLESVLERLAPGIAKAADLREPAA